MWRLWAPYGEMLAVTGVWKQKGFDSFIFCDMSSLITKKCA